MSTPRLNLFMAFVLAAGLAFLFWTHLRAPEFVWYDVDETVCLVRGDAMACDFGNEL